MEFGVGHETDASKDNRIMFQSLNRTLLFLSREGGWSLLRYEETLILVAASFLGAALEAKVKGQLRQSYFVERTSDRVSVIRFLQNEVSYRICDGTFSDYLVNLHINVDGTREVSKVTFYKGLVFSVEMKLPRRHYSKSEITVIRCSHGSATEAYTKDIDIDEHGPRFDGG
jgi:hypothetical protein